MPLCYKNSEWDRSLLEYGVVHHRSPSRNGKKKNPPDLSLMVATWQNSGKTLCALYRKVAGRPGVELTIFMNLVLIDIDKRPPMCETLNDRRFIVQLWRQLCNIMEYVDFPPKGSKMYTKFIFCPYRHPSLLEFDGVEPWDFVGSKNSKIF